jgi:hypothetical protein
MTAELLLAHAKALLPPGTLYALDEQGDLHKLFEAIAENQVDVTDFLRNLAHVRDPNETPYLEELEWDLGVLSDFDQTDATRRAQLASSEYNRTENGGTAQSLEELLRNAGFDVYVHVNDPSVDPALFPGDLLLNGPIVTLNPAYLAQCGGPTTVCGNINACCGRFDNYNRGELTYVLSSDPDTWPFVFFVGGAATRDPGTDALTAIAPANVPADRKEQFRRFILQIKPIETWAVLVINYV